MARFSVLILGGYGVFGSRVARLLAREECLRVIIAGRRVARARAVCDHAKREGAAAEIEALGLDIRAGIASTLASQDIDLVVDASGPFQGQDYGVAEACIAGGVHYCDLADGRGFVEGIGQFNESAAAARVGVLSGASTTPALSSAVVDALSHDLSGVEQITIGVTPGNRAPRGLSVVQAILSYAGQKIPRWENGAWRTSIGWQDLQRHQLGSLGRRWFSACDAPDGALFPKRYAGVKTVRFLAGLELSILHLGLWLLTSLVRLGLVSSLTPAARPLKGIADLLKPLGSDRGGMFVRLNGRDGNGRAIEKTWTLIAGAGDGPWIPAMAAAILTNKLASGDFDFRGAAPCMGQISLNDFERIFDGFDIQTTVDCHERQK